MRLRHITPAVSLLCLAIAGCTTVSQGEPTPAPTTVGSTTESTTSSPSSGSEDDLPSHGAPKVANPLDSNRFQQNPCAILTPAQAQELTLPPTGEQTEGVLGIDCEWRNPGTRSRITLGLLTGNPNGLSGYYSADQQGKYAYFVPLPAIEGYPAIASDGVDRRPQGICTVVVGVTDQLPFRVIGQLSEVNVGAKDPCEMTALVAGMALQTMKAGG